MCRDYIEYKSNISINGYSVNEINTNDSTVLQALATKGLNISQTAEIIESVKITKFAEFITNNVNDSDDQLRLFMFIDLYPDTYDPIIILKMIGIMSGIASWDWDTNTITYDGKTISFTELGGKIEKLIPETNIDTKQDIKAINSIKRSVETYSTNIVNISGVGMVNISQSNRVNIALDELLSHYSSQEAINDEIIHERIIAGIIILTVFIVVTSFMLFIDNINRLHYVDPSMKNYIKN
jgi:hypothetical protein